MIIRALFAAGPPRSARRFIVRIRKASSMYAVIKTGGKQYKVAKNDVIVIEKLTAETGTSVEFTDVLVVGGEGGTRVGAPTVDGARVTGTVLSQQRGEKVIVFKKRRRKNSRRKNGHRQSQTVVRISDIVAA
jgi:large subunit ribosomal protein L21